MYYPKWPLKKQVSCEKMQYNYKDISGEQEKRISNHSNNSAPVEQERRRSCNREDMPWEEKE